MLPIALSGSTFTKTRFAPTPSGYLHLGNIFSFSITARVAELTGAVTLLRIDDLDGARVREEYVKDIFDSLSFLDIPFTEGPTHVADVAESYSQSGRAAMYENMLQQLKRSGRVYACNCTRTQLEQLGAKGCSGICRHKQLPLDAPDCCWRLVTETDAVIEVNTLDHGSVKQYLPASMHDFIVRKKDGGAAYQLASVCDDVYYGVDLIVRGADLWDSTLAQLYLAKVLHKNQFSAATFYHHVLIHENGRKLSKSAGAASVQFLRRQGRSCAEIFEIAGHMLGVQARSWRELGDAGLQLELPLIK